MRLAHITLGAQNLWNITPEPIEPPPPNQILNPLKSAMRARRKQLTFHACERQQTILLSYGPTTLANQHTPTQQYITAANSDIHRRFLHTPAPYLRNTLQVATLPLLWARSQNKNIPDLQQDNHTTPYVGPPCLRCNPGAASTQGRLILQTNLPTDTYHHIVNDCVTLKEERATLRKALQGVMIDLGLENDEWNKIPPEDKTMLALASDPPKAWKMRMKTTIKWREAALPHCAQFALKARQTLQEHTNNP